MKPQSVGMYHPAKIKTWGDALRHNRVVNDLDELRFKGTKGGHCFFQFVPASPEDPFLREEKAFVQPFIEFVMAEQTHRTAPETQEGFVEVAKLRHEDPEYFYWPRYFNAKYYFGTAAKAANFQGGRGLDVGCLTTHGLATHYGYYETYFGMEMHAIDLNLPLEQEGERVKSADVRNLPFPNDYFDWATVPMVFGFGRPSDTILEIIVGLSELYRTTKGFVHIADDTIMPEVVFVAQQLGFRTYYNTRKTSDRGMPLTMPMGLFLIKDRSVYPQLMAYIENHGRAIPYSLRDQDLVLPLRDLLIDDHK